MISKKNIKSIKSLIQKSTKIQEEIGDKRDELSETINDLQSILDTVEYAQEDLDNGLDYLKEAVERLSEVV